VLRSIPRQLAGGIFCFAVLLFISAMLPLRLAELSQAALSLDFTLSGYLRGIAAIPGALPLGYLLQLPLPLLTGHSRLALRLVPMLCALVNCYLVWRLAKSIPLRSPSAAALVFLFLPVHIMAATDTGPCELALLFLLLATAQFFNALQQPGYRSAGIYAALLTLCIYTEPYSYLPALGYILFLLRFFTAPEERRAFWFLLPATALPALLVVRSSCRSLLFLGKPAP
jgi:hypothetical protein